MNGADFYLDFIVWMAFSFRFIFGVFFVRVRTGAMSWSVSNELGMNHPLIALFDWISIRILRHSHQNYYSYWCLMPHAFITNAWDRQRKRNDNDTETESGREKPCFFFVCKFWIASCIAYTKKSEKEIDYLLDAWNEVSKIHREIIRWVYKSTANGFQRRWKKNSILVGKPSFFFSNNSETDCDDLEKRCR